MNKYKKIFIVFFVVLMSAIFLCYERVEHSLYKYGLLGEIIIDGYEITMSSTFYPSDLVNVGGLLSNVTSVTVSKLEGCSNDNYIHLSIRDIPRSKLTDNPKVYPWGNVYIIDALKIPNVFILEVGSDLIFGTTSDIKLIDEIIDIKKLKKLKGT